MRSSYPPRRIAQIWLVIGIGSLVAESAQIIAHFCFGYEIIDKGTGKPASVISILVEGFFFGGGGGIFATAGWKLLRASKRHNDRFPPL